MDEKLLKELESVYRDLHENPELSFAERRTANIVATRLEDLGYAVTRNVGGTGVVGVLERGTGPTVLLRADMDGLPVREATGLAYASEATALNAEGIQVPIMHACGHDMHTTALLGAAGKLAADPHWSGKLMLVFQPAEEIGQGAQAMVDDGLFERFGTPVVVLGQHVAPLPAGSLGLRKGPAFAASDALKITLHGRGGHGSRPETTIDPVVLAASVVLRLQTIVSREIAGTETAVLTVGSIKAGDAGNIIPDSAELRVSVRTFNPDTRTRVLAGIERIVNGEALTAGAERTPEIEYLHSFPAVVNQDAAVDTVAAAFTAELPHVKVVDPGVLTGSEDVGILAKASGAACAYWLLGGADPQHFSADHSLEEVVRTVGSLPSNHSPQYAPVIAPTLAVGIGALHAAATAWLGAR